MPLKIVLRPQAEHDLETIYLHLAQDSAERAIEYVRRLRRRCETLAQHPKRGRQRDDLAPGLRVLAFERSAVIAYRVEIDSVRIIDIFYRGRDYEAILRGGLTEDD